jgi:hypothetical protein
MRMIRLSAALLSVALLLLGGGIARADLTFNLTPNLQSGPPGSFLTYNGTLSYTGADPIFLNDISFMFNSGGSVLTGDSSVFFNNVPGIFFDGDVYNGPIFGIQVDPSAAPLLYSGTATILGGADPGATDAIASADFLVSVTPEPVTWVMFLLGGVGVIAYARKRRPATAQAVAPRI